jgi:hypothetical protein
MERAWDLLPIIHGNFIMHVTVWGVREVVSRLEDLPLSKVDVRNRISRVETR